MTDAADFPDVPAVQECLPEIKSRSQKSK